MPFVPSTSPDFTEGIPFALGSATAASGFTSSGIKYDVAIGDLPFLMAPNDANPYTRQTLSGRKQQLDTSTEAGEQTLSQWWVRSEESFHRGAGIIFYEPTSDTGTKFRYTVSAGLDVWTQGQVSMLKSMTLPHTVTAGQYAGVCTAVVGGINFIYILLNGQLAKWDGTTTTQYTGEVSASTGPIVAGSKIVVGTTTGTQIGDLSGTTVAADATGASSTVTPYWVKSRLICAHGNKLTEAPLGAATNLGSATAIVTHPDANWTWSCVTECPGAILASGYSNGYGAIYKFTLDASGSAGGTPVISQGTVVAEFPPGEEVYSIKGYLGTYLAIGTTKGVRVGIVSDTGDVQYGPIIVSTTKAVRSFAARDTFIYAAVEEAIDGMTGCARIDLSQEITDLRFAWAWDADTKSSGTPTQVAFLGLTDRVCLGVTGKGVYVQSATVYETTGYLTTGAVRFSTQEPKKFDRMKIRGTFPAGTQIQIATVEPGGAAENLFAVGPSFDQNNDISLGTVTSVVSSLSLKFIFSSDGGHTSAPVLNSFSLKGLPQVQTQRQVTFPLMCYDRETDRKGTVWGYNGAAWARLEALEDFENTHAVVVITDYRTGESFSARIDEVKFVNDQPPDKKFPNFGGRINLTVTKLD